ncbi:MAG: hypothetical protein CVU89_03385 [Firmicutes bacterium HGW-Firmicutes-14]|nr:MAG: hypothetical protein CVU89_03385 [Firmicutes bacterium HGW-Firmicutes-14]
MLLNSILKTRWLLAGTRDNGGGVLGCSRARRQRQRGFQKENRKQRAIQRVDEQIKLLTEKKLQNQGPQQLLDRRNDFGVIDLTPFNAVRAIKGLTTIHPSNWPSGLYAKQKQNPPAGTGGIKR